MIPLPPGIQVKRSESAERALWDKARKWIERDAPRNEIHASDLMMPRKGYWRRMEPVPPSDREVGFFLVGRVLHAFILHEQTGAPVDLGKTDDGSTVDPELLLSYSPDKVHGDHVEEVKTSRSYYEPTKLADIETYLQQLLVYMAAKRLEKGRVTVFYINARDNTGKTTPQFRVYNVRISKDEIEWLRLQIRDQRNALADALQNKDHKALPLCPAWACHPDACPHWKSCQPEGRFGSTAYLNSKRK